jgi:hypothetical protein
MRRFFNWIHVSIKNTFPMFIEEYYILEYNAV